MFDLLANMHFDPKGPWNLPLEAQGIELVVSVGGLKTFTYIDILEPVRSTDNPVKSVVHLLNDDTARELIASGHLKVGARLDMWGGEQPLGHFVITKIVGFRDNRD